MGNPNTKKRHAPGGTKVGRDGCTEMTVEYEVREINVDGDCVNVDHYLTFEEANSIADRHLASLELTKMEADKYRTVAVVIEKHTSKRPAHYFAEPDKFEIVFTGGDEKALRAGDWIQ